MIENMSNGGGDKISMSPRIRSASYGPIARVTRSLSSERSRPHLSGALVSASSEVRTTRLGPCQLLRLSAFSETTKLSWHQIRCPARPLKDTAPGVWALGDDLDRKGLRYRPLGCARGRH